MIRHTLGVCVTKFVVKSVLATQNFVVNFVFARYLSFRKSLYRNCISFGSRFQRAIRFHNIGAQHQCRIIIFQRNIGFQRQRQPPVRRSRISPLLNTHGYKAFLRRYVPTYHPRRLASSNIPKQNLSHGVNNICDGSPSRIRMVRRISLGMTILPRSSILRTIPVAFIYTFLLKLQISMLVSVNTGDLY